jgi:translation initiation factor 6 (eIF-6)
MNEGIDGSLQLRNDSFALVNAELSDEALKEIEFFYGRT